MGHDLAINTAQLQSHATEVDACATTIESAQNIAAGTQNQVSQNAFGLMFLPYAAVAHFGIKNLSAMMKDISELSTVSLCACVSSPLRCRRPRRSP